MVLKGIKNIEKNLDKEISKLLDAQLETIVHHSLKSVKTLRCKIHDKGISNRDLKFKKAGKNTYNVRILNSCCENFQKEVSEHFK